jgi:hypothetical protein
MRSPKPLRLGSGPRAIEIYPVELYTYVVTILSVLALRHWGLRVDAVTVKYTFAPMLKAIPQLLVMGISMQLLYRAAMAGWRQDRLLVVDYVRSLGHWQWWVLWLRLLIAYMCVNYVYFWVKVSIPLVNTRVFDSLIWKLERVMHLGLSPNVLAVELFKDSFAAPFLDTWYAVWLQSVFLMITFFCAASEPRLRRSFLLSCALLWTLGTWIYMALPVLGPIYHSPDIFAEVLSRMPRAAGGQDALLSNYQRMVAGRTGPLTQFNPTRGIAAMPSLHVAGHFLMAAWARHYMRPLFIFFAMGTLLTFIASILTGWHYAVDGYVGIALAYGCYRLAKWWDPPETPIPAPASTAIEEDAVDTVA